MGSTQAGPLLFLFRKKERGREGRERASENERERLCRGWIENERQRASGGKEDKKTKEREDTGRGKRKRR